MNSAAVRLTEKVRTRVGAAAAAANHRLKAHSRASALFDLVLRIAVSQGQQRTSLVAAGAAFWLLVASFPAAIAAINIFGLVIPPDKVAASLSRLTAGGSNSVGTAFAAQLSQTASEDSAALSISLAVSIVVSVWGASAGAYSLGRAIRLSYGLPPQNYFVARSRSVAAGFIGVLVLGALALLTSFSDVIINGLGDILQPIATLAISIPLAFIILLLLVMGIFRYGIGHHCKFLELLPGAACASVGLLLLTYGFGVYLAHFGHYTAVYGAVAGIIVAMLLAYLSVYLILLTAILNAEVFGYEPNPVSKS